MIYKVDIVDKVNMGASKSGTRFFITRTILTLAELRQSFNATLILHHFDLECHIRIETNTSSYAIDRILS